MSVELWYGERPQNPAEQSVLIELYQFLDAQPDHYVVLLNFYAGRSHEIDLVVLKHDGIFLAELKHIWDKVFGGKEGRWEIERPDGSRLVLAPTRPNPYKQVQYNYAYWKRWCEENSDAICAGVPRDWPPDFSTVFSYIVIYPDLAEGSQIDIGEHPVQAVNPQKFMLSLTIRSHPRLELSRAELQRIPQLLGLTRWHIMPPRDNDKTVKLDTDDWKPPVVRMLVARGHDFSTPVFHLEKDVITVGRDPENDLVVDDHSVSRHHAELRRFNNRWVVRDLDSLNGTWVSYSGEPRLERRITGENALKNGSIVRFGQASFTLLLSE